MGTRGARTIVAAALVRGGLLLAQQRAYPAAVAGLWELPGGAVEPGESDVDALIRECDEELGIAVLPGERLTGDIRLRPGLVLRVYVATVVDAGAEPRPVEHTALRWLGAAQLRDVEWLPADLELLPALEKLLTGGER